MERRIESLNVLLISRDSNKKELLEQYNCNVLYLESSVIAYIYFNEFNIDNKDFHLIIIDDDTFLIEKNSFFLGMYSFVGLTKTTNAKNFPISVFISKNKLPDNELYKNSIRLKNFKEIEKVLPIVYYYKAMNKQFNNRIITLQERENPKNLVSVNKLEDIKLTCFDNSGSINITDENLISSSIKIEQKNITNIAALFDSIKNNNIILINDNDDVFSFKEDFQDIVKFYNRRDLLLVSYRYETDKNSYGHTVINAIIKYMLIENNKINHIEQMTLTLMHKYPLMDYIITKIIEVYASVCNIENNKISSKCYRDMYLIDVYLYEDIYIEDNFKKESMIIYKLCQKYLNLKEKKTLPDLNIEEDNGRIKITLNNICNDFPLIFYLTYYLPFQQPIPFYLPTVDVDARDLLKHEKHYPKLLIEGLIYIRLVLDRYFKENKKQVKLLKKN